MDRKYKIGDNVIVTFICCDYDCELVKYDDETKGTFWAKSKSGLSIPAVGIDGSEKWANIYKEKQK